MKDDFINIDSFEDFNNQDIDDNVKLGNVLKNKRVMLGLDTKKIAEALRVSEKDLISLESGIKIYDKNRSFGRLLCRKYLKYLEIDFTSDIDALVDSVYPTNFDPSLTQKIDNNITFDTQIKKDRRKNKIKKNIMYVIVFIVLISFAMISIKFLVSNIKDSTTEVINETTTLTDTVLDPAEVIEPEVVIKDTVTFKEYKDGTATFELSDFETPGTYNLVIEATDDDCYVDVVDAEGNYIGDTGVITAGDKFSYEITDQSKITVNLGNTKAAKITINETEVDLSEVTEPGKNLIVFEVKDV